MTNPYTRYPVYDGDIDHIIGIFHSKYLLAWSKEKSNDILQYTSEPLFVNEHNRAEWVLRKMTVSRKHLAIVLDEFGGTDAIVSHEDLIEEMLGMEIEDEMDEQEREKLDAQMQAYNKNKNFSNKFSVIFRLLYFNKRSVLYALFIKGDQNVEYQVSNHTGRYGR